MKNIQTSGTRKRAVARLTLKEGKGKVLINKQSLEHYGTNLTQQRIKEPIILAGDVMKKLDIDITTHGGGSNGQADAIRLAIGRALAEHTPALKQTYLEYDRTLLIADVRRKESSKPNSQGKARAKRQKSYR